ncbi:MAG: fatty acyl-AMP ligase [Rhodospirillales bacterium]|nr:fatty acyl-AMP ligase [Rhodospirillales bacterium]
MRLAETCNDILPLRIAEFETLPEALDYAARGRTGFNFFSSRGQPSSALTYAELRESAIDLARRLVAARFAPGSRIGIIAETTPEFMTFLFACQYASLVPVPLPANLNVGGHQAYVDRLRGMLAAARPVAAVGSVDVLRFLREAASGLGLVMVDTCDAFFALPAKNADIRPFGRDDPCYVQYSSGSTSQPRGIPVTQRALISNAQAIGKHGLALRAGDRATSWLPLYHDMGLVGFCLTPMLSQITVDYLATSSFALRPRLWLKLISEFRSTISFSPTFGYELCVRRSVKDGGSDFDLSSWRAAGVGGEMVRVDVLERFASVFAESGFDNRAFIPSYGLAEATLAVTFTPLGHGMGIDVIDRDAYERSGRAEPIINGADSDPHRVRAFVSCGAPLPGYEVSICDDAGLRLLDRTIGRVIVASPSVMPGYLQETEENPTVILPDGRLDTGDMGYMFDGELVITGRRKDMIICNGRNIWPQDLEWPVELLANVRSGSVAAFSVLGEEGQEQIVVVVECYTTDAAARRALELDLLSTVHRRAAVLCKLVLVAPRSLPYTSSGKLSRATAKAQYLEGSLTLAEPPSGVASRDAAALQAPA